MKKIITAINNPKLNEELKKEKNFNIIGKDIQYKEAILEILEKNKEIDLIIISEQILGEISFENLIEKIRFINEKIKIIFILEKENNDLENILIKNNIKDIYYNDEINLLELIKIINKNEINMEEEIIKLKRIIKENNLDKKEDKKLNSNKGKIINIKHKEKNKIISFLGGARSGKSTLSLIVSQYLAKKNYKILLIDADIKKQDLSIIVKENKKDKLKSFKKEILKINKEINLYIEKINDNFYFFNKLNNKIIKNDLNNFFNSIKKQYNFIIIDLARNNSDILNKEILNNSDLNFVITNSDIFGISETNNLLNIFFNKWKFKINNFQIILNKNNFFSINKDLISNFLKFKTKFYIIRENKFYSVLINNNFKRNFLLKNKKIEKDLKKIADEITK